MHFGRRKEQVQELPPAEEPDPKLRHAMESMDLIIRETRANRDRVRKVIKDLEELTNRSGR